MLAPLGATVAVVVLFVVVAPPGPTAGLPSVVAFCDKQADCVAAVVVTFVPLPAGPNDAQLEPTMSLYYHPISL
jgi:hypothetical protein